MPLKLAFQKTGIEWTTIHKFKYPVHVMAGDSINCTYNKPDGTQEIARETFTGEQFVNCLLIGRMRGIYGISSGIVVVFANVESFDDLVRYTYPEAAISGNS
jgi:hypothetical protein